MTKVVWFESGLRRVVGSRLEQGRDVTRSEGQESGGLRV